MSEITKKMRKSNVVYFNGKTVKDRQYTPEYPSFSTIDIEEKVVVDFYDEKNKVLSLKSKY